jgi:hypothetical protein
MMPDDFRKSLLKNIPAEKEKNMEIIKNPSPATTATPEERISALEKKLKEMEALVKGLTEEMLDLKSIAMRLNKVAEERGRAELKMTRAPGSAGAGTVVTPKRQVQPQTARTPSPPPEQEKMEMIMQPDGMLKPEKRKSGDYIVASASYSKKAKQQASGAGKKADLIVAEDEEKEEKK